MRQVPRNIDRPNRNAEYAFTSLAIWYLVMFAVQEPFLALTLTGLANYLTYKLTLNKPEGNMYRVWYKSFGLGRMLPPPKKQKSFQLK